MRRVITLCYHKVTNDCEDFNNTRVSVSNFDDQMRWLSERFDIIHLCELEEEIKKDGPDAIAITFDDGYADVFQNALPILEKYGIPATVFVTTGNIDTQFANYTERIIEAIFKPEVYKDRFELRDEFVDCEWPTRTLPERVELYEAVSQLFKHVDLMRRKRYEKLLYEWAGIGEKSNDKRVLSSKEINKLSQSTLITIGSHTVNHTSLKWISRQQQEYELLESKRVLEQIIGKEVEMFAYPWGSPDDYTDESIDLLKKTGYKYAFTTSQYETDYTDLYRLPRCIAYNYGIEDFKRFINKKVIGNGLEHESVQQGNDSQERGIIYIGNIGLDTYLNNDLEFLIWGCGFCGEKTFNQLCSKGLKNRIIGFGDNDKSKQGIRYDKIKVLSLETTVEKQKENSNVHILLSGAYSWEICLELLKKGLHNIHIYT